MNYLVAPDNGSIQVQFDQTPQANSLINASYTLELNGTVVPNAFYQWQGAAGVNANSGALDISEYYNYLTRSLDLQLVNPLVGGSTYTLSISGVLNAAGQVMTIADYTFTAPTATNPFTADGLPPVPAPVEIQDNSIIKNVFSTANTVVAANPEFFIVATDPADGDIFQGLNYSNGRITVTFSTRPAAKYINNSYFSVHKKVLLETPVNQVPQWLTVPVQVSLDPDLPVVYIDVPSTDATPVYNTPGAIYYQADTKYRLKISKVVGVI